MMKEEYLVIDGCRGEGGGQMLRASLALSMALGKPFHMVNIRMKRVRPGLKRQHLTCVRAAQEICEAQVRGAEINACEIFFSPGEVRPGVYDIAVGTGGSVSLVLQALVPSLLFAEANSRLTVRGGTHVPYAPPFEFMSETLFPCLEKLGPDLETHMERPGYMQMGGGVVHLSIHPARRSCTFDLTQSETPHEASAVIYGHNLPEGILERETKVLMEQGSDLGLTENHISLIDGVHDRPCPIAVNGAGNMVLVKIRQGQRTTVFGECGWRGRSAEVVAGQACKRAREYLRSGADVEACLSDQLLVPLALAGGGSFVTQRLTSHAATCLKIIELFTGQKAHTQHAGRNVVITVPAAREETC